MSAVVSAALDRSMQEEATGGTGRPKEAAAGVRVASRRSVLAGAVVLAATVVAMLLQTVPPQLPATVDEHEFSAQRAAAIVRELAREPRPLGSVAHERVREAIRDRLAALGLGVTLHSTTVSDLLPFGRTAVVRVDNILARLAGSGRKGAVLLVAHYDTRPATPGAGDDASGVATILETVRALTAGERLARDVLVLISDAEEVGLFGAKGFVAEHPWMDDVEFVLNLEARGNRGVSIMFETTARNLAIVREFAAAAPYPFANSLSQEVYRRMPNDSDFSPFLGAPVEGLNFAFIGGLPAYHTPLDTAAGLDARSLYQHGANALAMVRRLAERGHGTARDEGDAVYFPLPGWHLVVYPTAMARGLALLLVALSGLALLDTRRRQVWSPGGVGRGLLLVLGAVLSGACGALALWWALVGAAPFLSSLPHGRPYRSLALAALGAIAVAALVAWLSRLFESRGNALDLMAGVLSGWTAVAVVTTLAVPGGSYLFVWPALASWLAWFALCRAGGGPSTVVLVSAAAAIPGVVLFAPSLMLFVQALTLAASAAPAALFGLLLTLWAPGLARLGGGSRWAFVAVAALTAAGVVVALEARPAVQRPHVDSLLYVQDADGSWWWSRDRETDRWTGRFLGEQPSRREPPDWLGGRRPLLVAAAETIGLEPPRIEIVADERSEGSRRLTVEVETRRGAQMLQLAASSQATIVGVEVDGRSVADERLLLLGTASPAWRLRFELDAVEALTLEIVERRFGLPPSASALPRPPELMARSDWRTDSTYVVERREL